jgi:hypothetical protein
MFEVRAMRHVMAQLPFRKLALLVVLSLLPSRGLAAAPSLPLDPSGDGAYRLPNKPQLSAEAVGFPFDSGTSQNDLSLDGDSPVRLFPARLDVDQDDLPGFDLGDTNQLPPLQPKPIVVAPPSSEAAGPKVQWGGLIKSSLLYLTVMHSFRIATEPGTRQYLFNEPFVSGYFAALGNLHGWSDGDGYYENYLGHPIQGAVSAYIWNHYDPRYHYVQFGKSRDYWMSRLRMYTYAWAFSEQFEIGPISEASIGQIQRVCCAYGFVDHVITPNLGIAETVGFDVVDRYVVRRIEDRTDSIGLRILARIALNPPQSFANFMAFQYPWRRENRASPTEYRGELYGEYAESVGHITREAQAPGVPPFQITATVPEFLQFPNLTCYGGGGVGAFRLTPNTQWTVEVSGCTLGNSLPKNWSGDSLTFTTGPQWVWNAAGKWNPYFHVRFGGQKITEKFCFDCTQPDPLPPFVPKCPKDSRCAAYNYETTGFSIPIGGGLNVQLNSALTFQVANLEYVRSWLSDLNGENFDRGFRFSTGITLKVGTW